MREVQVDFVSPIEQSVSAKVCLKESISGWFGGSWKKPLDLLYLVQKLHQTVVTYYESWNQKTQRAYSNLWKELN